MRDQGTFVPAGGSQAPQEESAVRNLAATMPAVMVQTALLGPTVRVAAVRTTGSFWGVSWVSRGSQSWNGSAACPWLLGLPPVPLLMWTEEGVLTCAGWLCSRRWSRSADSAARLAAGSLSSQTSWKPLLRHSHRPSHRPRHRAGQDTVAVNRASQRMAHKLPFHPSPSNPTKAPSSACSASRGQTISCSPPPSCSQPLLPLPTTSPQLRRVSHNQRVKRT